MSEDEYEMKLELKEEETAELEHEKVYAADGKPGWG